MFYKGIVFDLDNTLYDYSLCHEKAITKCFEKILDITGNKYSIEFLKNTYSKIHANSKHELGCTASSHNKGIYFKQILEVLGLGYMYFSNIYTLYWDTFYNNISCFESVKEFIIWNKSIGVKIGILTDYELEFQIKKLESLGLLEYVDVITSSEEVGIEKPSIKMFQSILKDMKLSSSDVIMVGDNYEKDITGANNMGIFGYWFHKNNITNDKYQEFNSYKSLFYELKNIHSEIGKLVEMSRFFGERFDLVQGGGGNTSVKIHDKMIIKSSGINMINMTETNGYAIVNNNRLLEDINNNTLKDILQYNYIINNRASIETFMHSILKKYTIHLHPIQVNKILITTQAKNIIQQLFPHSLTVEYLTPGVKLCSEIKEKYNNESIIFLINHGIIITCDDFDEIYNLLENVLDKFEKNQKINFDKYKFTNTITRYIGTKYNLQQVSYLCQNETINKYLRENPELFKEKISFPDALIYCGLKSLFVDSLDEINEYVKKYNELPKIIITNNNIYITSNTLNKCKEIEDVLLSNLIIVDSDCEKNYLSEEEICFLNNWDAEKYRKLL